MNAFLVSRGMVTNLQLNIYTSAHLGVLSTNTSPTLWYRNFVSHVSRTELHTWKVDNFLNELVVPVFEKLMLYMKTNTQTY